MDEKGDFEDDGDFVMVGWTLKVGNRGSAQESAFCSLLSLKFEQL